MELTFTEKPKSRGKASMGREMEIKISFRHNVMRCHQTFK